MKPSMRIFALVVVLAMLLTPFTVLADTVVPGLHLNSAEAVENPNSLTLNVYFTLVDTTSGTAITDAQIQSVEITQLDTSVKTTAAYKQADTPFYIALVLDQSGSMQPSAQALKAAAKAAINNAPKQAQFAVVAFDEKIQVLHDFTDSSDAINAAIDKVNPISGHGTCLYDAAYQAVDMLSKAPAGRRAAILFTDGKDELAKGGLCSQHSYDEVVNYANKPGVKVPISTIGISGNDKAINAGELQNMASTTGGFSAIGNSGNMNGLFDQIMKALSSQWLATADIYPTKGKHDAVITVTLRDGTTVTGTISFQSSKDYIVPPSPVAVNVAGVQYIPVSQAYQIHLAFTSPQLIKQLTIAIWDDKDGVKLSESSFNNLPKEATIQMATDGMKAGSDYVIRISMIGQNDEPIKDDKGAPLVIEHKIRFDPNVSASLVTVDSVAINGASLAVKLIFQNGDPITSLSGWLNDEATNAQVPNSAFTIASLPKDNLITIPMTGVADGKYTIQLKALDKNGQTVAETAYQGVVYTAPAAPSLADRLGVALKAAPWILGIIIGLVVLVIAWLIISSMIAKRNAVMPVLQGKIEADLSSAPSKGKNAPLPLSQTMTFDGPIRAAAVAAAAPKTPLPLAMMKILNSPDPHLKGATFMVDHVPLTIGRVGCDILFDDDQKISRKHAQISYESALNTFFITDLKSVNGIFLNGVRIPPGQPTRLLSGMVIGVGPDSKMVFELS
jgi:VWFA-related protein